ncbi:hypothetical protein H4R19_006400, partial [Coemansia spiralis]
MLDIAYPSALGLAALGVLAYFSRRRYIEGCRVRVVLVDPKASATVRHTEAEGIVTLHDVLHIECPSLTDPERAYMVPTPYLATGLLQTIYATLRVRKRSPGTDIVYERELLVMTDAGTVSIDWLVDA